MNKKLAQYLKIREEYERRQKALIIPLQSTHSHAEVLDWANCFPCQQRYKEHLQKRAEMNLKNPKTYLNWKKRNR